jgi:hypothetical protein
VCTLRASQSRRWIRLVTCCGYVRWRSNLLLMAEASQANFVTLSTETPIDGVA